MVSFTFNIHDPETNTCGYCGSGSNIFSNNLVFSEVLLLT